MSSSGVHSTKQALTDWSKSTGGHQDGQESEQMMYKERLWKKEKFILEKRRETGHLFVHYNYLIRGYREDKARPFPDMHSDRTRNDEHKLERGKI